MSDVYEDFLDAFEELATIYKNEKLKDGVKKLKETGNMSKAGKQMLNSMVELAEQYGKGDEAREIIEQAKKEKRPKTKKRRRNRSWNVGKIKKEKLVKTGGRIFWDLDWSVCVILRDLLYQFADIYSEPGAVGFTPLTADGEFAENNEWGEFPEDDKVYHERFQALIRSIADKFDYYVQNDGYRGEEATTTQLKEGFDLLAKWLPYLWL